MRSRFVTATSSPEGVVLHRHPEDAARLTGWFPWLKRFGGVVAALFGGPLATYTGMLFANTAVPSWHAAYKELPFVFGASGMAAGGGAS